MRKLDPVKHEEKRREILDAAERCFLRDGLQGASIASICAEAGISPGHLYHYFDSKEEIGGAMIEVRLRDRSARFGKLAEKDDILGALLDEVKVEKTSRHPLLMETLTEAKRNPAMAKILQQHTDGLRSILTGLLKKGQTSGRIDPSLDPDMTASLIISIIDGSKTLLLRNPKLDPKKATAALQTLIARYLRPPPAGQDK